MLRWPKHVAVILLFGFSQSSISAQETFNQSGYFWQRYYFKGTLSNRFVLHIEAERRSLGTTRFVTTSLLPRVQLHYVFAGKSDIGVGVAHFMNNLVSETENKSIPVQSELRLNQVFTLNQPMGRVQISHRYQLEERLFLESYNDEYLGRNLPFQYGFRFRYLFLVKTRLTPADKRVHIFLEFADELLLQISESKPNQLFEANRFYGAVQAKFSTVWALEVGYLTWIQQQGDNLYSVPHILRITLQHSIDFRKQN